MSEPARVSFMLAAAQVSLERVVTFLSSSGSLLFLILEDVLTGSDICFATAISLTKRSVSLDIAT